MKKIILLFFLFTAACSLIFAQNSRLSRTFDSIPKNYLVGKFNPAKEELFVPIDKKHTNKTNIYILSEVYEAFIAMRDSAKKDNVNLIIVSAFRSFFLQKFIWESKWNGTLLVGGKKLNIAIPDGTKRALEILKYSSMPGISRHHWGTDIDINSTSPAYFQTEKGKKELNWLKKNATHFGFWRPYTDFGENRETGFQPEEWHWSYIKIAKKFQKQYIEKVNYLDIEGFCGDDIAFDIEVIKNYVLSIDKNCFE